MRPQFKTIWDPSRVTADQIFRVFYLIHLAAMQEPESQICGCVVIMDFDGLGMKQVKGLSPSFSLRLLSFIQDAMPLRLKEVHIVNQPFLFNMVWAMFKPFIREKLKKRMFFHGNKMKSLHEHIDPNYLPENYGGKLPKINYSGKDWYPVIRSIDDDFKGKLSYLLFSKRFGLKLIQTSRDPFFSLTKLFILYFNGIPLDSSTKRSEPENVKIHLGLLAESHLPSLNQLDCIIILQHCLADTVFLLLKIMLLNIPRRDYVCLIIDWKIIVLNYEGKGVLIKTKYFS
ncbi:hypothetical protein C0J52_14549 [Blattella germanica]|nr:hypothetical protein C0J52_14549 [Blattella germanica]